MPDVPWQRPWPFSSPWAPACQISSAPASRLFVEVIPGAGDDAGGAGARLEADPAVARPRELWTRRPGPVGEAVLVERVPGEHGCGLAREGMVRLEPEQGERVASSAVQRAEAAVVVVLPPQPVVAAAGA